MSNLAKLRLLQSISAFRVVNSCRHKFRSQHISPFSQSPQSNKEDKWPHGISPGRLTSYVYGQNFCMSCKAIRLCSVHSASMDAFTFNPGQISLQSPGQVASLAPESIVVLGSKSLGTYLFCSSYTLSFIDTIDTNESMNVQLTRLFTGNQGHVSVGWAPFVPLKNPHNTSHRLLSKCAGRLPTSRAFSEPNPQWPYASFSIQVQASTQLVS